MSAINPSFIKDIELSNATDLQNFSLPYRGQEYSISFDLYVLVAPTDYFGVLSIKANDGLHVQEVSVRNDKRLHVDQKVILDSDHTLLKTEEYIQ